MSIEVIQYILVGGMLAVAVYTDVRRGKVYNWLTAPMFVAGLAFNALFFGVDGLINGLLGGLLALGVYIALGIFGHIVGAGDAKLMMAVGAWLGPRTLGWGMIYGAIAGGLIAIILAIVKGRLVREMKSMASSLLLRTFAGYAMQINDRSAIRIPYAVPLALGVLVAIAQRAGVILA